MLATDVLEGESRVDTANCTRCNSQLLVIRSKMHLPKEKFTDVGGPKLLLFEEQKSSFVIGLRANLIIRRMQYVID